MRKTHKTAQAKAGTLLLLESGEYSDYSVTGFFVVLKTFTPHEELEAYLVEHPKEKDDYTFDADAFLAGLLAKGLLLEITHGVIHLCDYSRASEFSFTPTRERDEDGRTEGMSILKETH